LVVNGHFQELVGEQVEYYCIVRCGMNMWKTGVMDINSSVGEESCNLKAKWFSKKITFLETKI